MISEQELKKKIELQELAGKILEEAIDLSTGLGCPLPVARILSVKMVYRILGVDLSGYLEAGQKEELALRDNN